MRVEGGPVGFGGHVVLAEDPLQNADAFGTRFVGRVVAVLLVVRMHVVMFVLVLVLSAVVVAVEPENTAPDENPAPAGTFQTGRTNDTSGKYLTYRYELEGDGPPGQQELRIPGAKMDAQFSNLELLPGDGIIGGDVLEFDVTMTNTSTDPDVVLSAFAFQSKNSESPALASRLGDKLFYGQLTVADPAHAAGPMASVKKNGTSQGLLPGKWKGICINSSTDFIPEFNSGLEEESLECGGNRSDENADGEPELQTGGDMLGLRPGESQTVRLRLDSGTTDGALHVVEPGTLQGRVVADTVIGPNGVEYLVPEIDNTGVTNPNVVGMPDFGDNKVLRDANGDFNPTFAPSADDFRFDNQIHLTLPRRNFAFTDLIGRNHSCATYGLTLGACSGGGSPEINFLDDGDLVPGVENFAALLRGFGEFYDADGDLVPDENPEYPSTGETRPSFPYNVAGANVCENCGGEQYVPIAEFFVDNGDGSLTQSVVAGEYGDPATDPYLATVDAAASETVKEEIIPEADPGGPCDPVEDPNSRRPSCLQLRTSATGHFYDLDVALGAGINGGDAVEFTVDVQNTSTNPEAYLTAFNYQTKKRGLADIGVLDGFTQDRRDIRVDSTLPLCTSLSDEACWNETLGVGHFPNVIGNGLLFGQMVWTDDDAGREAPVDSDQVYVDPVDGIDPTPFKLESVKKNGPFTPILKGNVNFICLKSGLFDVDPDADAGCAGEPAILIDEDGEPVPTNITQRLGLAPTETQSVRMRMEWGDFRGAMLEVLAGTLTDANVNAAYGPSGTDTQGLARFFDCSDQRELEFCHPDKNGDVIGYVPNTDAEWLTPATLEEIEHVIVNQPGDAPTVMNFQDNFGKILAMSGFVPSAEFYAPDPSPDLLGTPFEGVLIRQQILGEYGITDVAPTAVAFTSTALTTGVAGTEYRYDANATAFPGPIDYSLDTAPSGMTINDETGVIKWTPPGAGSYSVRVRASNGSNPDAVQSYSIVVPQVILDNFNRANGKLGSKWGGVTGGYAIANKRVDVGKGGLAYWKTAFSSTQEAAVTLSKIDTAGQNGIFLKGNTDTSKFNGIVVTYDAKAKAVKVIVRRAGKTPSVVGTFKKTLVDGNRLSARAAANGSVTVRVNGVLLGTASAGSYFVNRSGNIGVVYTSAKNAFFDDFGGGNVAV